MPTQGSNRQKPKDLGRRTDSGLPEMRTPKGYAMVCYSCHDDVGQGEQFMSAIVGGGAALSNGTCDLCGAKHVERLGIEKARYDALLERIHAPTGS